MNYKFDKIRLPTCMPIALDTSVITSNWRKVPHFRGLIEALSDSRYDLFVTKGVLEEFGKVRGGLERDFNRTGQGGVVYDLATEVYERLSEKVRTKVRLPAELRKKINMFFMITNGGERHPVDINLINASIAYGLEQNRDVAICSLDEGLKTAFCTTVRHLNGHSHLFYVSHDEQFPLAKDEYFHQRKGLQNL